MMQMEQDKLTAQLGSLELTKTQLKQIAPDLNCDQGMLGAIVITDSGKYYMSVGLGKIVLAEEIYYTISPCLLYTSPSPRDQRGSRMPSSA